MPILYRPPSGVCADFIPFYWKGEYHLFYLRDFRDVKNQGEGTPWYHLVTRDFVHFDDLGEAIPRGPIGAQDVWVFTGCVVEHEGVFHIFYTGHNSHLAAVGRSPQGVMHATSPDLKTWTKDPGFQSFAPTAEGYERDDWRDPLVFWDGEKREWNMLLAARRTAGPTQHRGCIACVASPDLRQWEVRTPFWEPMLHFAHECPDHFSIGDWWYLLWSEFSERHVTHYRMSRSPFGPWTAPADDAFDTRAYYAAKTAGHGGERYLFGWLATRDQEKDSTGWQWGGELVAHRLVPRADGTLRVVMPDTVAAAFTRERPLTALRSYGPSTTKGDTVELDGAGRFTAHVFDEMPNECLIEASVIFEPGTIRCGFLLRADAGLENYYQVRLEPARQRLVFDRRARPGDEAFMAERPLAMAAGEPVRFRILVSGTNVVVYAGEEIALSCRMYEQRTGGFGFFVADGRARFQGRLKTV